MACLKIGAALALMALTACGGRDSSVPAGPSPVVPTPNPAPTPTAATARYHVTFESSWRRETHPTDFPANAHFSRLVGATHSSRVRFWQDGGPASQGIQDMAERGRTSPLDAEVQAAISAGTAYSLILGGAIDRLPGRATAEFDIEREHPLVTLVSMVAPSPDWFVGTESLSLVEGGDWAAETIVTLHPWDAGTDSGPTYTAPDQPSQPRQAIRLLEGYPVASGGVVPPFGTFRFRRVH